MTLSQIKYVEKKTKNLNMSEILIILVLTVYKE